MATFIRGIGWPAFLAACMLESLVFAFIDPHDLRSAGPLPSRSAVYTLAFFAFWLVCMGACALTLLLRPAPAGTGESPAD